MNRSNTFAASPAFAGVSVAGSNHRWSVLSGITISFNKNTLVSGVSHLNSSSVMVAEVCEAGISNTEIAMHRRGFETFATNAAASFAGIIIFPKEKIQPSEPEIC
jgi:hypothetical protein